jgi:hypothetical protein
MKRIFFVFFLLFSFSSERLLALVVVPGSPLNPATTLPVAINFFPVINQLADGVFISAGAPGAQEFALAGYKSGFQQPQFVPYAEQTVSLDGETTTNPLYNAQIDLVSFAVNLPSYLFAIPNQNSPILYFRPGFGVLSRNTNITDANGNPASSVAAMVGMATGVYMAVTPQGSTNFGDPGSGITVVTTVGNGLQLLSPTPLNAASGPFTLGTDPVTMVNGVSLAWSIPLNMVYCAGAQMTSGAAPTDRIGLVARGQLDFTSILIPTFNFSSLVAGTNYGVVATGASVEGVIAFEQLMEASTKQVLLVTCGRILNGGETPADVQNQVYAFPLSTIFDPTSGLVVVNQSGFLAKQGTMNPAMTAADLYTIADAPVRVGQGPLPNNAILSDLQVNGDCVYAIVNTVFPGVYMSRALFDVNGLVIGWTPWVRIINTPTSVLAATLNTITGTWLMLTTNSGVANTILRSVWQTGNMLTGVANSLMQLTAPEPQSITALNGYDYRTPGLGDVSLLVSVERNQVILAQTGFTISTNPTLYQQLPDFAYGAPIVATNTVLNTPVGSNPLVQITGGIFNDMEPLTTATIAHSDTVAQSWLVVGGEHGVAIWATPTGAGWGNAFGSDLSALPLGLVMQSLGNYTDVRTVYADAPFLYIATSSQIDRIDLTNGIAGAPVVTIAKTGINLAAGDVITNILFCKELGLMSTNSNLFRIASGSSARAPEPQWVVQEVPESEFPMEAITGLGLNGLANSLDQGGDFWVLSGTARNNRSIVNRFAVNAFAGSITDDTIEPFACDWFVNHIPSFFLDFGSYQDSVVSDGAQYLFARSVEFLQPSMVRTPNVTATQFNFFVQQPRSMNRFIGSQALFLNPPSFPLDPKADINVLMQEPATGAWYIATSTGLIVQG